MTRVTHNRIVRKHGGKFDERANFTPIARPAPRRYRCSCQPNGFVFGQVVKHYQFCPFHQKNIEAFKRRSRFAYFAIALAIGICGAALAISFLHHV